MARGRKEDDKCLYCTVRKRDEKGVLYCPHLRCIFEEKDLKFWREAGGTMLLKPSELGLGN